MEEFSCVGRIFRNGPEQPVCGGIVAISKYDLVSLVASVEGGDVKILLQHFAATRVNDACRSAELLVAGGRDVFFHEIH